MLASGEANNIPCVPFETDFLIVSLIGPKDRMPSEHLLRNINFTVLTNPLVGVLYRLHYSWNHTNS